ncbi:hypothetical protein GRJ2_000271200 [Grus japonensis]|uniref:Uncharacterized protein n=1 Tax=Grus japonensis TaxID=30415 RepID=A0ABC9VZC1_GRUJA
MLAPELLTSATTSWSFVSKSVANGPGEVILPFCLSCVSFKIIKYVKYTDILEHIQQITTKTSGHWISQCTKKGTKLNLFSLKWLKEELIAPYNSLLRKDVVNKDPDPS